MRELPAHPNELDIDIRAHSITARLQQFSHRLVDEVGAEAAQVIQRAARFRGLKSETTSLRSVQIAVAHATDSDVKPC